MDASPDLSLRLTDCEVCRHLQDAHYACSKVGSEEDATSLPPEAWKLVPCEPDPGGDRKRLVKRCPLCGTHYLYELDYEYLAGGSEDSEELSRLTPTEAKAFLKKEEYEGLFSRLREDLSDSRAPNRRWAGRCFAGHYLESGQVGGLESLLRFPDAEVVAGAVAGLAKWASLEGVPAVLSGLEGALGAAREEGGEEVRGKVDHILGLVRKAAT